MSGLLGDLPRLFPRPEQTIAGIGRLLRQGEVSCVDLLNACLEQVDRWESKVHAWVVLDQEGALAQARALDEELRSGQDRGPLHGIPIGIKDIIDVKGLPTACGMARWADRIADTDADPVGVMRGAGAVIMGKTVTTACAWIDPPTTRNPWNLERTPGGSSSGSAAAVACGMCYAAFGTQTGGSVTRPASFCGIAGMKPSKQIAGFHPYEHVYPFAPSLDHVGYLARTADDLRILFDALRGHYNIDRRPGEWAADARFVWHDWPQEGPSRFARLRGFFDRRAEPSVRSAMDDAVAMLTAAGSEVRDLDDPVDFDEILVDHRNMMAAEAACIHGEDFDNHPEDYPPRIRDLILEGRSVPAPHYVAALWKMYRAGMSNTLKMLSNGETLIIPATIGTAPDTSTTGDPAFNSPWSYTGLPTISVPIGLADDGLPVAVQLVGIELCEDNLLDAATWFEDALRTRRQ